jgi:hypothetical protein
MDESLTFQSKGRGFESLRVHQKNHTLQHSTFVTAQFFFVNFPCFKKAESF